MISTTTNLRSALTEALSKLLGGTSWIRTWAAIAVAAAVLGAACGGSAPTPTADPRLDQALEKLDQLSERVRDLERRQLPGPTSSEASAKSAPSVEAGTVSSTPALPSAGPGPTPNPANAPWVRQRLDAVIKLYNLTDRGVALVQSLDLRQMRGEPGFFGSFGFKGWAGVGESKPIGVMHELSHSYWGGFPVSGFPDLTWDARPGHELAPALERYHADILAFMKQPPDGFELFRQRLRNLPELSQDNTEPLFHNLEADMVYGTGGNLALVPPILRKYWDQFLNEGPIGSWNEAVVWYQSLSDEDRSAANKFLGFEHLDLRRYAALAPREDMAEDQLALIRARTGTLAAEERQRLFDLADQFDLLLGDAQEEEKFQFWRGYLRDKTMLYGLHPDYLDSLELPRAAQLASALKFIAGLSGSSFRDQALSIAERLPEEPFLVNFLPALDNRTLQELFKRGTVLPQGETLQATASFVERLERFSGLVAGIITDGKEDPQRGADALQALLDSFDFDLEEDLRLFSEILREEDPPTASSVIQALDKETVRRLMAPVPVQLRFLLNAAELLAMLDITAGSQISELKRGIRILIDEPSGNFTIDEPFLALLHQVIADRVPGETAEMLGVLQDTPFPLEGFIQQQPQAAVRLLSSDLDTSVKLLLESDSVVSPPARIVSRLINADPHLAATLVQALDQRGEAEIVLDSLAYFAYDKVRLNQAASLPISLEQDGRFLAALVDQMGESTVTRRLREAFAVYGDRVSRGEVGADFLSRFRSTLKAASSTVPGSVARETLERIILEAAGQ